MLIMRKYILPVLVVSFTSFILFFSSFSMLFAEDINWIEVANTNNEILYIDANSIKYNNKGLLSVVAKYSQNNPDDQIILNTDSYLLAIDCDSRLFSKLPVNGDLNQVKNWEEPTNNKLIKKTILNSCFY